MTATDSDRLEKLALIMDGESYPSEYLPQMGYVTQFPAQIVRVGMGDFTPNDLRAWIDLYNI